MSLELVMPFLIGVGVVFLLIFGFFVLFKAFYIKVPQGTALIMGLLFVALNAAVDLACLAIDPRRRAAA